MTTKKTDPGDIAEVERSADAIVDEVMAEHVSPQQRLERIAEVEQELRVEFPASYKRFLAKNFGLTLPREWMGFHVGAPSNDPDEYEVLEYLFTVGADDEDQDLLLHAIWYRDLIPANLIAIGTVVNKDLVCLTIDGSETGEIAFLKSDGEGFVFAGRLAENVDEFIASLFEV